MEFQRLSSGVTIDVFKFEEFSCNFSLKTHPICGKIFFVLFLFCILNRFNKTIEVSAGLVLLTCNPLSN